MTHVSIIIPAYQSQDHIITAVQSIFALQHKNWEIVIISDDGQDYEAALHGHGICDKRIHFCSTGAVGAGPGVARNIGQRAARYDIVTNLDADDTLAPDYLDHMLPAAVRSGVCTPAFDIIDEESREQMSSYTAPEGGTLLLKIRDILCYHLAYAAVMYDRKRCNVAWPELHYGEDLLFWLRLLDKVPHIEYVSQAIYHYTHRKKSLSHTERETTHWIYEQRRKMIEWIRDGSFENANLSNHTMLWRWLESCNEMEEKFGFKRVDTGTFLVENNQRFDAIFGSANDNCDIACS